MNTDQLKGKWKQFHGAAKIRWAKLTDDDWTVAEGSSEKLAGRIQERYGDAVEKAHRDIDEVYKGLK